MLPDFDRADRIGEQEAGRVLQLGHALPSLPEPQERILRDLLGLLPVPRDQAHGPEVPWSGAPRRRTRSP
jgi:hypothetical protein